MPTITKPPQTEYFRTEPSRGIVGAVDREKKVIFGVSLIQLGRVNDSRPWHVDATTLQQVLEIGGQSPRGLKSRFAHPNLSNDGLATFLGRYRNFRLDGERVRADLHLSPLAFKSPKGNLGQYVLDLAEEDPEAFGNSIAGVLDFQAMEKTQDKNDPEELQAIRFRKLRASDIVDDPAATRGGLFSLELNGSPDELPELATRLLDQYFSAATSDVIRTRAQGFVETYLRNRDGKQSIAPNRTAGEASVEKYLSTRAQKATDNGAPADMSTNPAATKSADTSTTTSAADAALSTAAGATTAAAAPATPAKPELGTATNPEPGQLRTAAQIERDAALAENDRVKKITALCNLAGHPELVEQLTGLEPKFSIEEAKGALFDAQIKKAAASNLGSDAGSRDLPGTKDPEALFKREYSEGREVFTHLGVTEEAYIASRRIDAEREAAKK